MSHSALLAAPATAVAGADAVTARAVLANVAGAFGAGRSRRSAIVTGNVSGVARRRPASAGAAAGLSGGNAARAGAAPACSVGIDGAFAFAAATGRSGETRSGTTVATVGGCGTGVADAASAIRARAAVACSPAPRSACAGMTAGGSTRAGTGATAYSFAS